MAVTSIHPIRATVSTEIRYIINPDKTVNGLYVSSYLCRADSGGAAEDFSRVRKQGQERFTRAETLGEEYTAERLAEHIEQIQKLLARVNNISAISKPETSEIPEIKPIEKKEDKWADIRGMWNADMMIAELESEGVESLNMLKSFMWNIRHDDDHTDELASLKKEIKAVDTLISKIKHRDEIAPIYKEYKGLKGFRQSRFRKKNADVIEDYEKTVDYIKEHRKSFYADGKPLTMLDLLDKSNALKSMPLLLSMKLL